MITAEKITQAIDGLTPAMRTLLSAEHLEANGKVNPATRRGLESRGILRDGELTTLGMSVAAALRNVSGVNVNGYVWNAAPATVSDVARMANLSTPKARRSVKSRQERRLARKSRKIAHQWESGMLSESVRCTCKRWVTVLGNGTLAQHTRPSTDAEYVSRGFARVHCERSGQMMFAAASLSA